MRDISGLVFIISGASSGLGKALALEAAKGGARLALCGRSSEKMSALGRELDSIDRKGSGLGIEAPGSRVDGSGLDGPGLDQGHFLECFDATKPASEGIEPFVRRVLARYGRVDVLVNCAGANRARGPAADLGIEDLDAMMKLNCYAPLSFIKACHPAMAAAGGGLVLNVLSTCCLFANEGLAAYTASKAAFEGIVKVYRKEARKAGIRVTAVYPGGIDTPFRPQPRPDYLRPEAVAQALLSLVEQDEAAAVDELVLRPLSESNFA